MFVHRGKLVINNEAYDKFIRLMKSYDELLRQHGLVNSYLIEVENAPGHFWHETFWHDKASWEAFLELDAHKAMHEKLESILLQPVNRNFGNLVLSA